MGAGKSAVTNIEQERALREVSTSQDRIGKFKIELGERFENVKYAVEQVGKAHVQYVEGAITMSEFMRWVLILPTELNELSNVQQDIEFEEGLLKRLQREVRLFGK